MPSKLLLLQTWNNFTEVLLNSQVIKKHRKFKITLHFIHMCMIHHKLLRLVWESRYHNAAHVKSHLPGCYALSTGKWLSLLWRSILEHLQLTLQNIPKQQNLTLTRVNCKAEGSSWNVQSLCKEMIQNVNATIKKQ
jgi:hypothetical protein